MNFPIINELIANIKTSTEIDRTGWGEFKLIDLFPNYAHGSRLRKCDREIGELPLVTAGQYNNGISEYIIPPKKNLIYKDCITIDMFGNCFYHDYEFVCDDNVYPILDIPSKNIGLFLCAVIHNEINYTFKKQFREKELKLVKIKLPINPLKTNEPNWDSMEEYIKILQENLLKKLFL